MAYSVKFPFYGFRLQFKPGQYFINPLTDKEHLRINTTIKKVARAYAQSFQQKVLNQGDFKALLDEYREGHFIRNWMEVPFPPSRDGISYPAFSLAFEYFYNEGERGAWGIVPVLGIEAFAPHTDELARRLGEAIQIDFARSRRLAAVQDIIATIWFDSVELLQQEIELYLPGLKELERTQEQDHDLLLPQVARRLDIDQAVVYYREAELERIDQALKSQFLRNVLLVGRSGVGKTALVWETARRRKQEQAKGQIWETTASLLIKELTRETDWRDNLAVLCQELAGSSDMLFVRNLMELFEVGKYEGNDLSMADYLQNYLSRGEVTLISECSEEELARIELMSSNYLSLFTVIRMDEPGEELESIILKKVKVIARHSRVDLPEAAIKEVIRLNRRFTPYSGMPGKPIRFLESILLNQSPRADTAAERVKIDRSQVIQYFCEESGLPAFMVDPHIPMDTRRIKAWFSDQLFGQDQAIQNLVDLLASVKTALTRTGKPIASLLFVGPTGVGKTELAKLLAEFMFGSRERVTRFDMSEFSSPYAVMRLIGTSYHSGGLLTSAIRREPFSVLLFDEIEKAHSNFYDLLLQMLSEGRLTDSRGKLVDFCSTIIILTSNIGSTHLTANPIGWDTSADDQTVADYFVQAVRKHFRPELFNRLDQVIPFLPLDPTTIRFVVDREIKLLKKREGIRYRQLDLDIDPLVLQYLAERGYSQKYGARQLQRSIREELIQPMARILNTYEFDERLVLKVRIQNARLEIEPQANPLGLELLLEELAKIQQADYASHLRRKAARLLEGAFYVRLLSQLDILEREKQEQPDQFWSAPLKASQYAALLKIKEQSEWLAKRIEKLELELGLASMGITTYKSQFEQQLNAWEEDLLPLQMDLYRQLHPEDDHCQLGIYGHPAEPLGAFYYRILEASGYAFTLTAVWFRESYYQESGVDAGVDKKDRERFIKQTVSWDGQAALTPPQPDDVLYGLEFSIYGPCAYLYLGDERGGQRWTLDRPFPLRYYVKTDNRVFPTPDKIHRKEFYGKEAPRRSLNGHLFSDSLYKINREVDPRQLEEFLREQLDQRLHAKLELLILDDAPAAS